MKRKFDEALALLEQLSTHSNSIISIFLPGYLGYNYFHKSEYDKALVQYIKASQIQHVKHTEKHLIQA